MVDRMSDRMPDREAQEQASAGFAPDENGARWTFVGALTYASAGAVLAAATRMPLPATGEVDLADVDAVDSAAVAVLVALKRRAASEGRPLTLANPPTALTALAQLYGVEEILVA
jgi:phospholipid transport system transporter-binding protein